MPRRLRIEFEGAIYHVMTRGNARQDIVHDDDDRRRLLDDLERAVTRRGWRLLCFVLMSNHLHLLLQTPQPNLARGMQGFLSSYAHWCLRRRRRAGHLFQGRFKAEMIEDETHYWVVSRYIHLNPVRAGLVAHPAEWPWSSYPGYGERSRRFAWVAHETLLAAWRGELGGADPVTAYRRFVEAGLSQPPLSPFREAFGGWVLGSDRFVARLRALAGPLGPEPSTAAARHLSGQSVEAICAGVAAHYGLESSDWMRLRAEVEPRSVAAWLCRRYTEAPLRELAGQFGLSRAGSVSNLTRRVDALLAESPALGDELAEIMLRVVADQPSGIEATADPSLRTDTETNRQARLANRKTKN